MKNTRSLIELALTTIALLALSLVTTGCHRPSVAAPPSADAKEKQPSSEVIVRTVQPEKKTVKHTIEQPGFNIEAFQETALYSRITGYVRKWNVNLGDRVRENDVLAELHVPEMLVELKQKEANVRQVSAQIEQARAGLLTAQAQLDRAKSQFDRLTTVGQSGVLDPDSVDEVRLGYEAAKAGIVKANADVVVTEAQLDVAKCQRDYAETMLQYANIRAPFDGVVTQRIVDKGDFVQAASGNAQPLFVVSQLDPVRVFINVPGMEATCVRDGDPVTLRLQGAGGETFQGKVTRNACALNPQTRTLLTEIDVPNPDGKLKLGMYVQASINVQRADVWTLPSAALVTEGEGVFCFRVEQGKAVRTPLQIGLRGNGIVEVRKQHVRVSPGGDEAWIDFTGAEEIVLSPASLSNGQAVRSAAAN